MLEVRNIHKTFGHTQVLKGIDFKVDTGEVVAVIGPSGSGKTTLLRCISFLERADEGEMTFDEFHYDMKEVTSAQIWQMRMQMGFVFQNYNLFRNMTAKRNVMEGLVTARKMDKKEAERMALEVLEKVGLSDRANFYPDELSGGQQQRVAIARAVVAQPRVILFDEPTSALDPELTGEVLGVMKRLADAGTTMVVVTHEMEFARSVADRVVFMEDGCIVEDSPAERFFDAPKQERSAQFVRRVMHRGDYQ